MKISVHIAFLVLISVVAMAFAAPEPAIVQTQGNWTADVKFEPLKQVMVPTCAEGKKQRFWYLIISITNNSEDDIDFYPCCDLVTDTFQIVPAGIKTSPFVFQTLKKLYQSKYPFLEPLNQAGTRILQGQDNTTDIAIIWPDFDGKTKSIKLYISGLSNETVAIDHPLAKDENGKPLKVFLRKTLELSYDVSGDPALRSDAKLSSKGSSWVMR